MIETEKRDNNPPLCSVKGCKHPPLVCLGENQEEESKEGYLCIEHCKMRDICWGCGLILELDPESFLSRDQHIGLCCSCFSDFISDSFACDDDDDDDDGDCHGYWHET